MTGSRTEFTSQDLVTLLRAKYPQDAYAVLEQVHDRAGFGVQSRGDVVVMGLWPSRGLQLEGFEIKVSRPDWLHETRQPRKAENLFGFCDRWWLLAASADLVLDLELPETWGLLVPKGRGLTIVKPAPKLEPAPLDRSFLAALLKRAWQRAPAAAEVAKQLAEAKQEGRAWADQAIQRAREETAEARAVLAEFEKASGIRINEWSHGQSIGEAVKLVLQQDTIVKRVMRLRDQLCRLVDDLDGTVAGEQLTAGYVSAHQIADSQQEKPREHWEGEPGT